MKGKTKSPHHRASIDCPIKVDALNLIGNTVPAYWISRCIINDPVVYKRYTDQVPDIIAKYGAKVLARGGHFQIMEGPEVFKRFVVIEFPTLLQPLNAFNLTPTKPQRHTEETAAALLKMSLWKVQKFQASVKPAY